MDLKNKMKIVTITMLLALLLIGTIEATKVAEANDNKPDVSQAVDLQLNLSQPVHIDGKDMSEIMNNAVQDFREENGYNISFTVVCKLNECQYGKAVEQKAVKGSKGEYFIEGTNTIIPYPHDGSHHGWEEWVESTDSSGTARVGEAWRVPTAPTSNAGQILFFFNGKDGNTNPLLQPVLEWNNEGSNRWWIRSWWIYNTNNDNINSPTLNVDVGDTIYGEVRRMHRIAG